MKIDNRQAMRNFAKRFREIDSITEEELFAINMLIDSGALEAFLLIVSAMMAANIVYFNTMLNNVRRLILEIGTDTLIKIGNGVDDD